MTDVNRLFREAQAQAGTPSANAFRPEVVALYKKLKAMHAAGQEKTPEYSAAHTLFNRLLGLRPWMLAAWDLFRVDPNAEPGAATGGRRWGDDRDWHDTVALRRQLDEAAL